MNNLSFVLMISLGYLILYAWAFRHLPRERWQVLASIPVKKREDGNWMGVNLTWYGFFWATSCAVSVAIYVFMLAGIGSSPFGMFLTVVLVLAVAAPAASLVARLVEDKKNSFTVAGAAFAGFVVAPPAIFLVNLLSPDGTELPTMATMAALSIAYILGEGMGRLSCISFGCCYGKTADSLPELLKPFFNRLYFVFQGENKKIAYASGLHNRKVVPVQGMTAVLYTSAGLLSLWLFLESAYVAAFLFSVSIAQIWRIVSEFLRADYRGEAAFTPYQAMGVLTVLASLCYSFLIPAETTVAPDIGKGLAFLWNPLVLILLQLLWVVQFIYSGWSKVTTADLRISVVREQ